jgi:hypothetical protein
METADTFKNAPIHDKRAILELMDSLEPKEMVELVDFLKGNKKNHTDKNEITINTLYPQFLDVMKAVVLIQNSLVMSNLNTPMLTKTEQGELMFLLYKWKINFTNHRNEVIDGMITELSK